MANPPAGITNGDDVAPVRIAGPAVTLAVRVSPAASASLVAVPAVSEVTLMRISAPTESVVLLATTVCDDVFNENEVATAADAGVTEDIPPKPKAATVTSAMRLKVVFVDICFLSISRTEEFPQFGLN